MLVMERTSHPHPRPLPRFPLPPSSPHPAARATHVLLQLFLHFSSSAFTGCCAEHVRIIHAIGGHLTSSIAFLRFKLAQEIGGTFVHKRLRNCKDKVGDLGEYLRMKKFDVRMNCVIPLEI